MVVGVHVLRAEWRGEAWCGAVVRHEPQGAGSHARYGQEGWGEAAAGAGE